MEKPSSIRFIATHRMGRSPSQRYRFEQYFDLLSQAGHAVKLVSLLNRREDQQFYMSRSGLQKIRVGMQVILKRFVQGLRICKSDHVFIHKQAFFFGWFFEWLIAKRAKRSTFSFDDAIWLKDENPNQGLFNKLKTPGKVAKICRMVDQVVVGNEYLAAYARQFNPNVAIIPSTIDLSAYDVPLIDNGERVCIGWTGSFSTIKHFETVLPVLRRIRDSFGDQVYFKVIGDPSYAESSLGIQGVKWQAATEATDLAELDVGLMPLPDNEWTRGKCSMKALQYMALGIPAVISPVGMNKEVIQDGVNGFLADTEEEWVQKLSLLIEDKALRKRLGEAGKKTVVEKYSVEANKEKWLKVFQT